MNIAPVTIKPYNWFKDAVIFNKNFERVTSEWFFENADVIVLLFTAKGTDREGIVERFYEIYENVKFINLPIEVIYIPMDKSEEDMRSCFEEQANWFALKLDDPLVLTLKYMYGISCIPHILVLKIDCSIISTHGIMDLEVYGKNAIITWLSTSASTKNHRKFSKDVSIYGDKWRYMNIKANNMKQDFNRKFNPGEPPSQS